MTCDTLLALDGGSFPFRSSVREVPPREESCFASRAIPQPGMKYPSSSWNAQLLAMRVSDIFPERFEALEDALFGAMFRELRDVSDPTVLRECARGAGVPKAEVDEAIASNALRERASTEHEEGEEAGISGIPAVLIPDLPPITGAVPADMYRQALRDALGA